MGAADAAPGNYNIHGNFLGSKVSNNVVKSFVTLIEVCFVEVYLRAKRAKRTKRGKTSRRPASMPNI
jgi:hypothetical protein